jgi:hypothetical protein
MPSPTSYHFKLPKYSGPPLAEPPHTWFPGIQEHQLACTSDRTLRGDGKVRAFVIHATAGADSVGAMSVMFAHKASWHWLIPDENEPEHGKQVWACAPEARAAWHVRNECTNPDVNGGKPNLNYSSLGMEIVNTQSHDPFSDWQVRQAAALVRYAWSKYPELVDVVAHAKLDPSRRTDPGTDFPWDRFQSLVLQPVPVVAVVPVVVNQPIRVLGPRGQPIACDPRSLDGVTVGELRPIIEALGFHVQYDDGPPMTVRILEGGPAAPRAPLVRSAKKRSGASPATHAPTKRPAPRHKRRTRPRA